MRSKKSKAVAPVDKELAVNALLLRTGQTREVIAGFMASLSEDQPRTLFSEPYERLARAYSIYAEKKSGTLPPPKQTIPEIAGDDIDELEDDEDTDDGDEFIDESATDRHPDEVNGIFRAVDKLRDTLRSTDREHYIRLAPLFTRLEKDLHGLAENLKDSPHPRPSAAVTAKIAALAGARTAWFSGVTDAHREMREAVQQKLVKLREALIGNATALRLVAEAEKELRCYSAKRTAALPDPFSGEVQGEGMLVILAQLRAMYQTYQHAHWESEGANAYGKHLMFQRLYESVQPEIDSLAEKLKGYYPYPTDFYATTTDAAAKIVRKLQDAYPMDDIRRCLTSEQDLQKMLKVVYEHYKSNGSLTLGLDDWLMATSNTHDTNVYLLQQHLANSSDPDWVAIQSSVKEPGSKQHRQNSFSSWVAGRKFRNPKTGRQVKFSSLPAEEQSKVRSQHHKTYKKSGADTKRTQKRLNDWHGENHAPKSRKRSASVQAILRHATKGA